MGQFSAETSASTGSTLNGNQHEGDLESAQLRVRTADRGAGGDAVDKMDSALVAIKGLPWTTFQEMKGDNNVLTKIEEAEELLKALRKALTAT